MPDSIKKRDERTLNRQGIISTALSAIVTPILLVSENQDVLEWKKMLEKMSEARKLIADFRNKESNIRRSLRTANVDNSMN